MREDSDHFRHYVPLLRRIVIVVAVLAAIPVISVSYTHLTLPTTPYV